MTRRMGYGPDAGEPISGRSPSPRLDPPEPQGKPPEPTEMELRYTLIADVVQQKLSDTDRVPFDDVVSGVVKDEGDKRAVEAVIEDVGVCVALEKDGGEWFVTGLSHYEDQPSKETMQFFDERE